MMIRSVALSKCRDHALHFIFNTIICLHPSPIFVCLLSIDDIKLTPIRCIDLWIFRVRNFIGKHRKLRRNSLTNFTFSDKPF